MSYAIFDNLALADVSPEFPKPAPFRLLKAGANHLTKNGKPLTLTLSAEQIAAAAEYQAQKGEKIPIDSRHALLYAAQEAGVEEGEAAKQVDSRIAALGFASLEAREDGLYAVEIELLPLASKLFELGCLRYFSPVIRGLDGKSPLRITSVAMDNVPALSNLPILAAGGEDDDQPTRQVPEKGSLKMTKLEQALGKLIGDPALALGAETEDAIAEKVEALAAELPTLRYKAAKCDELALAAEQAEKRKLVDAALAGNRITNAEVEPLMKQSTAFLSEYLATRTAPAVPTAKIPEDGEEKTPALTDEEKEIAERLGLTPEEYAASKKTKQDEEK